MRHSSTDDFSTLILSFLRAVVASRLKAELCSPGCLPALIQHAGLCKDVPWHQGILTPFSSKCRNNTLKKTQHYSEVGWHRAVWTAEHQHFNIPQCRFEKCVFCVLRCCWRWLPKRSSIMGSVSSTSALRPAAKGCLISPNFT